MTSRNVRRLPSPKGGADCRFAQSKEEELGQAAEVGLLDRFIAREGARFPVNEPPAGEQENANSAWQRIGRTIHPGACVRPRDLVRTLPVPDSWAKDSESAVDQ